MVTRFDTDNIKRHVRAAYADNVYFYDTLKELRGVAAVEEYMLKLVDRLAEWTMSIDDVAGDRDGCYLRWTMSFRLKRYEKKLMTSSGISHLRFDEDGRIVYHQDYWDPVTGLFEHLPVIGGLMRMLKRRM